MNNQRRKYSYIIRFMLNCKYRTDLCLKFNQNNDAKILLKGLHSLKVFYNEPFLKEHNFSSPYNKHMLNFNHLVLYFTLY